MYERRRNAEKAGSMASLRLLFLLARKAETLDGACAVGITFLQQWSLIQLASRNTITPMIINRRGVKATM